MLQLFETELSLNKKDAAGLLISSVHLLGDGNELRGNASKFLAPSKESYSEEQARSAVTLISRVAGAEDERHENARELVQQVEAILKVPSSIQKTW